MIHHPNRMGLTDDKLFGLILDDYFHNSKFQNFGCGCCKMKTGLIFKNLNNYHSIFMIYHPNQVGLTDGKLFGLILDDFVHDSKTQNFRCGC